MCQVFGIFIETFNDNGGRREEMTIFGLHVDYIFRHILRIDGQMWNKIYSIASFAVLL